MSDDKIPVAIWAGTFRVWGVDVRCAVLDNGQRVINSDDLEKMLQAMGDPATELDADGFEAFARWQRGLDS